MKNSIKAALISGIVCPGAGHFLLKQYWRGAALLLVTLLAIGVLMTRALQQATTIADKIASGEIPLDPEIITAKVHQAASGDGSLLSNTAMWTIFACWIIGIVDAYRLGKQQDRMHAMATAAQ